MTGSTPWELGDDGNALAPDSSRLARVYRWLAFAGAVIVLLSFGLGMLGLYTLPPGLLLLLSSLLVGTRWLYRQPGPRALWIRDWVLLAFSGLGTLTLLYQLLTTPHWFPWYFVTLGLLFGNATLVVPRPRLQKWVCAAYAVAFVVAPVLWARSFAFLRAVQGGDAAQAQFLLWMGADPNAGDGRWSAIQCALLERDLGMTRLLLEHGADPNAKNDVVESPVLLSAVHTDKPAFVALFLDHGADPNLSNRWGETALFHAARFGQAESARLLLARGADRRHVDREGRRAADVASERGYRKLAALLEP